MTPSRGIKSTAPVRSACKNLHVRKITSPRGSFFAFIRKNARIVLRFPAWYFFTFLVDQSRRKWIMRKSWLLCALLGTLAWGQAAQSAPPPAQPAPSQAPSGVKPPEPPVDKSASVPDDAAVITIDGVCPAQPKTAAAKGAAVKSAAKTATAAKVAAAECKTIITKAQFEKLADAVAPATPTPQLKKQLASMLPRLIALSNEAQKEGLDKTPQFAETVKFVKMQVLSNQLQRKIQKEAADVPEADIEKYYKDNPEAYSQYNVDRIFVPRTKQGETEAKEDDEKEAKMTPEEEKAKEAAEKAKADEAEQAMTKLADELRDRAAKGEDFTKLQKEAYTAAGMKLDSPSVNLANVRRTGLPPGHVAVFDLKPGEVSQVISDAGGHYIYKMNSSSPVPLEQAKNEIHAKLQNDRMHELMDKVTNSFKTETNEAYFGPGGASPMPPRMPRPRPGMPQPGAQPSAQPQAAPPAQAPPSAPPQAAKPN
jgi:peptidyl-prolyl cis-trans isomerase C